MSRTVRRIRIRKRPSFRWGRQEDLLALKRLAAARPVITNRAGHHTEDDDAYYRWEAHSLIYRQQTDTPKSTRSQSYMKWRFRQIERARKKVEFMREVSVELDPWPGLPDV